MKLINYNLVQQPQTTTTASSSNVNYSVSNLAHEFRSKVWRSSGSFVIDATNNKIDFKESGGGSELHSTITSGTYTATTLAAEIKTQLEVAGAETYTVTWSQTTGLWTVLSAGSYLSLLNNTGTNQATSTLKVVCGFANSDRTGAVTYTGPNIAIHTSETVTFDMATSEDIDSVVLLWPKEDGMQLSDSAVVKIQANATNVWTSPTVNQTLTADSTYEMFSHYFSAAQSYRYWRVEIVDPTNTDLYVSLGVVILGVALSIDNPDSGFSFSNNDLSTVASTQFGNQYVDEYPIFSSLEMNFDLMDYDDAQAIENAFRTNGIKTPVFVTMDATSTVFNKNHFAIYGKFQTSFYLKHLNYNLFQSSLTISEIA